MRMIDKLFSKLSSFLLAGNQRLLFRVHPINANATYFAALESSRHKLLIVISLRIESNYKVARQEGGPRETRRSSFYLLSSSSIRVPSLRVVSTTSYLAHVGCRK